MIPPPECTLVPAQFPAATVTAWVGCAEPLARPTLQVIDTDLFVLRFLVGNGWDTAKAGQLVAETAQWRIENNVDAVATKIYDGLTMADFPYRELVLKYVPELELHGADIYGVPMQFRLLGRVQVEALMAKISTEQFMVYAIHSAEMKRHPTHATP